ncbi:MAG: cell-wall [Pseudomonadota bacterium]|jgi:hypothetical protein
MDIDQFRDFVSQRPAPFRSERRETEPSIRAHESALGFELPPSLKWLLTEHGYSAAAGVQPLEDSVARTLACRTAFGLPDHVLILNHWEDAGVVFCMADDRIDCDYAIAWADVSDLLKLAEGVPLPSSTRFFINFAAWSRDRLRVELEALEDGA